MTFDNPQMATNFTELVYHADLCIMLSLMPSKQFEMTLEIVLEVCFMK